MEQKTILISLGHGVAVRNVLQTDIFSTLQKSGIKIVLLSPNSENQSFCRAYSFENVFFERLETDKYRVYLNRSKIQKRLRIIRWFTLNGRYDISTISDWYEKVYNKERPSRGFHRKLINFIEDSLIHILRSSGILRKLLIYLEYIFFTPSYHRHVFMKYKPQWVLVTGLGIVDSDMYIMREAKRHGAKVISIILSWDNTSTRGMAAAFPDRVIAWTDIMKKELIELHDMKPEKIFVGGVAQFDHYYRKEALYTREEFFNRFGLSPDRKLIFFATKSPTGFPWNPDIVEIIADAIRNEKFVYPCQLLVRIHPIHFVKGRGLKFKHFFDRYNEISRKYRHVIFNTPSIQSWDIDWDMPKTELSDVASILHYTDVMVNVFSTMNLEACIFDLPIINVCFEGPGYQENKLPRVSVKIDEMQSHNQRVVQTGGIRLAYSKEELIALINMYLENPQIDKEGRAKIVQQECSPNHGEAGRRIGKYILELLAER